MQGKEKERCRTRGIQEEKKGYVQVLVHAGSRKRRRTEEKESERASERKRRINCRSRRRRSRCLRSAGLICGPPRIYHRAATCARVRAHLTPSSSLSLFFAPKIRGGGRDGEMRPYRDELVVAADNGNKPRKGEEGRQGRKIEKQEEKREREREERRGERNEERKRERERVGARRTKVRFLSCGGRKGDGTGGVGDLRIRRKKEQGREAGRYHEQCANRVHGFSPRSVPSLLSRPFLSVLFLFIIQWGQEVLVN